MRTIKTAVKMTMASFIVASTSLVSTTAWPVGTHEGGDNDDINIGQAGESDHVTKTINVELQDIYFEPEKINVKSGETIRFTLKNVGEFVHEFNIGTPEMHVAHQAEMSMMVEHGVLEPDKINRHMMKMDMGNGQTMKHDDPNSKLLEPGETAEIIWTFSEATVLEFACNIPGHNDSGMAGLFEFNKDVADNNRSDGGILRRCTAPGSPSHKRVI